MKKQTTKIKIIKRPVIKEIVKPKKKIKVIKKPAIKYKPLISKEITFSELLNKYPGSANILFESGLHCIGCGGAMYESIEQGCLMHGFSKKQIDELVKKINRMI